MLFKINSCCQFNASMTTSVISIGTSTGHYNVLVSVVLPKCDISAPLQYVSSPHDVLVPTHTQLMQKFLHRNDIQYCIKGPPNTRIFGFPLTCFVFVLFCFVLFGFQNSGKQSWLHSPSVFFFQILRKTR